MRGVVRSMVHGVLYRPGGSCSLMIADLASERRDVHLAGRIHDAIGKGLISRDTLEAALKSPAMHLVADPHVIIAATRAMQDFQLQLGVLAKPVIVDDLFDTRFYDAASSAH